MSSNQIPTGDVASQDHSSAVETSPAREPDDGIAVEASQPATQQTDDVSSASTDSNGASGPQSSAESRSESPRRKPRLNPKLGRAQAKAVPSLGPGPTVLIANPPQSTANAPASSVEDVASEPAASIADDAVSSQPEPAAVDPAPAPSVRPEPVEIPPSPADLDAQMEAEIEAALSSGEVHGATVVSPPQPSAESPRAPVQAPTEETLEKGMRLTGKILSVHGDDVFIDLGLRSPGVVPKRQFVSGKSPEVGQMIEVSVDRVDREDGLVLVNLPKGLRKASSNWESIEVGQIVDCMVTKTNKGGLEVTVSSLRGFLPAGQVDLNYISDLEPYVGQKLRVKIIDANPKKRNLVVSRRAYLQIERKEAEENLWKTLEVGQKFAGTVSTLKDYGAFVDIGGVDGFLHIGEMSWTRLKHPSELLQPGQKVDVKVLALDPEKKKISLGMRQLTQNPWAAAADRYPAGQTVSGQVTRITDFGAFVELEPGLEGLIHISELEYRRVKRVDEVLKVGQTVVAKVLEVDSERKRIGLSLKALLQNPDERKDEEDLAPAAVDTPARKRKSPLRGGMGQGGGRGLFGNPGDYK
ncbi:MAG: S1 RNA-binding domain-containing protein [Planctomycetaceae bacterium]